MTPVQPSEPPALVYLAALQSAASHRTMQTALNRLFRLLGFEPVLAEQRGECQTHVPVLVS